MGIFSHMLAGGAEGGFKSWGKDIDERRKSAAETKGLLEKEESALRVARTTSDYERGGKLSGLVDEKGVELTNDEVAKRGTEGLTRASSYDAKTKADIDKKGKIIGTLENGTPVYGSDVETLPPGTIIYAGANDRETKLPPEKLALIEEQKKTEKAKQEELGRQGKDGNKITPQAVKNAFETYQELDKTYISQGKPIPEATLTAANAVFKAGGVPPATNTSIEVPGRFFGTNKVPGVRFAEPGAADERVTAISQVVSAMGKSQPQTVQRNEPTKGLLEESSGRGASGSEGGAEANSRINAPVSLADSKAKAAAAHKEYGVKKARDVANRQIDDEISSLKTPESIIEKYIELFGKKPQGMSQADIKRKVLYALASKKRK